MFCDKGYMLAHEHRRLLIHNAAGQKWPWRGGSGTFPERSATWAGTSLPSRNARSGTTAPSLANTACTQQAGGLGLGNNMYLTKVHVVC